MVNLKWIKDLRFEGKYLAMESDVKSVKSTDWRNSSQVLKTVRVKRLVK